MVAKSIKEKIFKGLVWTYAERTLAQFISLIVTIILARLIEPEEYGIIAIVIVFISIADTFAINGLGNALIQKKDADQLDFSSVFYFNIVFSLILYAILYVSVEPIAKFYEIDQLVSVLRVMALRVPVAAINSVQQAYVSKRMEFKKFFFSTLAGTLVSAIVGIILAYSGYGVWALVAQYMTNTLIDTVVLWFTVGWRPEMKFSWLRTKVLYSYGWKVLATSLLINIYGNIQDLIIGKKFSADDLAYNNKGRQFPSLIATNINTSISKVLFPAVAEVQDDIERVKVLTRRAISVGTYILSPVLIGLAAVAEPFVQIVLTEKWIPSVPYLQIMCLVFLLQPLQTASVQAMKALGESGRYLKLEIIKKTGGVVILLYTVFLCKSVMAIVLGSLVAELFSTVMNFPANKKLLHYNYTEQISDVVSSFLISFIMAFMVFFAGNMIESIYMRLLFQVSLGGLLYLGLSVIMHNPSFLYLKDLFRQLRSR